MKRSLSDMKRENPREPFELTDVGPEDGKVTVAFVNPKKLHWTKLATLDEAGAGAAIATLIEDVDQYRAFCEDPEMDGEALEWVMNEWRTHFGLGQPGESNGSTS